MSFTHLSVHPFQLNKDLHQSFPHSKIFTDPKALVIYLEYILVNREEVEHLAQFLTLVSESSTSLLNDERELTVAVSPGDTATLENIFKENVLNC